MMRRPARAGAEADFGAKALQNRSSYFDESLWPHLRAAYNLARWLVRNDHDAEEVVQESFLKAFQAVSSFRGTDPRVWLLSIVRNTALNLLRRRRTGPEVAWNDGMPGPVDTGADPEKSLIRESRREQIRAAIEQLPAEFREALVLREIEGLSYKEIAAVSNTPIGTVMSRLARARGMLVRQLIAERGIGGDLSRN